MNWAYQYNAAGHISQRDTESGTTKYAYDKLSRLTKAEPPQLLQQQANLPIENYSYDAVDNRTSSTHQPGAWVYNANNQLTQWGQGQEQTNISYTATGHTETETKSNSAHSTRSYVYDAEERLIQVRDEGVETAHYQYDPFGRRIKKTASGQTTYYLYNEQGLIAELNANGQMQRAYGWQPDGTWGTAPVWQAEVNASRNLEAAQYHYLHNDHLGTPQVATDESGNQTWRGVSEAFGKTTVEPGSQITMNVRFPGQYYDEETGLHQNYCNNKPICP